MALMARAATTSDVFNAIAEPQRREILVLLRAGEWPVTDLARELGLQVLAERTVTVARPRQDRDEPAAPAVDVAHCGTRAQLGVRDVEEVGASEQIDQVGTCVGSSTVLPFTSR